MPVPKAAVYEDCDSSPHQSDVRSPGQIVSVHLKTDAESPQRISRSLLRRCVLLTHARHHLAAYKLGASIGHVNKIRQSKEPEPRRRAPNRSANILHDSGKLMAPQRPNNDSAVFCGRAVADPPNRSTAPNR